MYKKINGFIRGLFFRFHVRKFGKEMFRDLGKSVAPGITVGPLGSLMIDYNNPEAHHNLLEIQVEAMRSKLAFEKDQQDHPEKYLRLYIENADLVNAKRAVQAMSRPFKRRELKQLFQRCLVKLNVPNAVQVMKLQVKQRLTISQYIKLFTERAEFVHWKSALDVVLIMHSGITDKNYREMLNNEGIRIVRARISAMVAARIFLKKFDVAKFHQMLERLDLPWEYDLFSFLTQVAGRELSNNEKESLFTVWLMEYNFELEKAYRFAFDELGRQLSVEDFKLGIARDTQSFFLERWIDRIHTASYLSIKQKDDFEGFIREKMSLT